MSFDDEVRARIDANARNRDERPWGPGNNPKTAVWKYLETHPEFQIDRRVHQQLLTTVAPDGYLVRVK